MVKSVIADQKFIIEQLNITFRAVADPQVAQAHLARPALRSPRSNPAVFGQHLACPTLRFG